MKKAGGVLCVLFSALFIVTGCTLFGVSPERAVTRENALKKVGWFGKPDFIDDLDRGSLFSAIEKNLVYLNRLPETREVYFGHNKYTVKDLKDSCIHLAELLRQSGGKGDFSERVRRDFDIYVSAGTAGTDRKRSVLFTGYYEPVFSGSRERDKLHKYPLYRKPDDLLEIGLEKFSEGLKGKKIVARLAGSGIFPYFTRKDIEVDHVLAGRNLELVWLSSPLDVFFLHIQGSGIIRLEDESEISVNYSSSNGRKYSSIGRLLIEQKKVPREKMSMQAIRSYLSNNPGEIDTVLNYNESYVFFREVEKGPLGSTNVTLTPERSIAADSSLFPKGALAFIDTEIPDFDSDRKIVGWKKASRFVFDQDRGGAIKGPGRADIFFGTGEMAGRYAGRMNRSGRLFYLVKGRS